MINAVFFFDMSCIRKMRQGYSLIEILMVIVIVALLATIAIPVYTALREKAGLAGCFGNMRNVGLGLNAYMQDNNMVWPQMPKEMIKSDDEQHSKWWADTLKSYGIAQKYWICPLDVSTTNSPIEGSTFTSSYALVLFDDKPNTAFRWKMPWAVERPGVHGQNRGGNMLMPDGTIQEGYAFPSGK